MIAIRDAMKPHLAGKARLKWDAVRDKHLLLFPEGVLVLNKSAHDVLELCDGRRVVGEIIKTLAAQYANDAETIDGDVREILQKLAEKSLVTISE